MLDLSGIQPPTKAIIEAAGGELKDKPSEGKSNFSKSAAQHFNLFPSWSVWWLLVS